MSRAWIAILAGCVAGAISAPNIVYILTDDHGWGDVSYNAVQARQYQPGAGGLPAEHGGPWQPNPPRTPNIDALALSNNTLLLHRCYSGSPVCSPTRASTLTGRTPDRDCIFNANGCGQEPAAACNEGMPLPTDVFTLAEAAQAAGLTTMHIGKWHLGNFFPKPQFQPTFANKKWPVSHPGMHGFDAWLSTEASASSSMCNCGCEAAWVAKGGCVIGGGHYSNSSFACTNYWFPTDSKTAPVPACHVANTSTASCVANLTSEIPGDDSAFIFANFQKFHDSMVANHTPYMALLWLHTNHVPHPAMPEFYFAYNDTYGNPAGDYLGTLTQMDAQIGRIMELIRTDGTDTMVWLTADNGPHTEGVKDARSTTNGLRQCKASVFEGGIRVPGMIWWPKVITAHRESAVPVSSNDVLPTLLDVLNIAHPQPAWAVDGESLLPLISNTLAWNRTEPLRFKLGSQLAYIDPGGQYKLVVEPEQGQCPLEGSTYGLKGSLLFDLLSDPSESFPLNKQYPDIVTALEADLEQWQASILASQVHETGCAPAPVPPPPPPAAAVKLMRGSTCLFVKAVAKHMAVYASTAACTSSSNLTLWDLKGLSGTSSAPQIFVSGTDFCIKIDGTDCQADAPVFLGEHCNGTGFVFNGTYIVEPSCPTRCVGLADKTGEPAVESCVNAQSCRGWHPVPANASL